MTRRIAVFTGTRADYGLLSGLMRRIADDPGLTLQVIAAAGHFAPHLGLTWREIEGDGFAIAARVEVDMADDSRAGTVRSLGACTSAMADALHRLAPEAIVILGDRFEALAAAQAALLMGIPIAHVHGGEITEGAFDDAIRHAITKMASLHFVAAEPYRQRVIQMGTPPERVFTVGAPGLDAVLSGTPMPLDEVAQSLGFDLHPPFVLATYHTATNAQEDPVTGVREMLAALDGLPEACQILLTYPNADHGGRAIIAELDVFAAARVGRVLAVPSLGFRRYQAVMRHASAVVGNSSSGVIEAPSFGVPSVNIGGRQAGRLSAQSVRHAAPDRAAIHAALVWALSDAGKECARTAENPYGQGQAAAAIHAILARGPLPRDLPFHDTIAQDRPQIAES
jgi:UDP-N-acetylglucosamine 2-epimerase (non-hydrolysing)